ncbi:MAG: hypothetical protein DMG97_43115 [Acidobacteria bacterium]|nr:MAG: hypothetical protein DMG97_43115 [Acidobacteriota bacterium]
MAAAWTRKNQPLLVSLINQLLMVAGDADSDLFDAGAPDNNDGNGVANLTYRITALYSGRESVLGASAGLKHSSAGLKHFGMRRLGHSGAFESAASGRSVLANRQCLGRRLFQLFPREVDSAAIEGARFVNEGTLNLMRHVLCGIDSGVLETLRYTTGAVRPKPQ